MPSDVAAVCLASLFTLAFLDAGSYGAVAEAVDHLTSKRVAIKQIKDVFGVFENAKRIYREIKLLRSLNHVNIVKIVHIQKPK